MKNQTIGSSDSLISEAMDALVSCVKTALDRRLTTWVVHFDFGPVDETNSVIQCGAFLMYTMKILRRALFHEIIAKRSQEVVLPFVELLNGLLKNFKNSGESHSKSFL